MTSVVSRLRLRTFQSSIINHQSHMDDQAKELRQLVRQHARHDTDDGNPRPRRVVVTSGKGGVGTTTVAVNLAVALARQGPRVLLVDAAPYA